VHNLNLNHLRYFYVTAQIKSVTKAAEMLSISQPSLSQQLSVFEEKIGFPLYYRNGRSLDLTPKGKILFDKAVGVFSGVDDITNYIQKKQSIEQNLYSIAVCDEIERPFISDVVGQLVHAKISESYKYDIISKNQFEITPEFYNSKHDLFITNRVLKKTRPFKVFEFPVNLVTSKPAEVVHKLKDSPVKRMLVGLGEKLVLPSQGVSLREELDHFLNDIDLDYKVAFESNILGCVTRAVKQKVGCSFLPMPYVYEELKQKRIAVLGPKKGFWQHKIYMYSKIPLEEDPVSQKIISTVQSYLNFD
jgi:LysR family transcriptional regulator, transcriptional activator of nhaA